MAETILPKKAVTETPIATNDSTHAQLTADPQVSQFPQQPATSTPAPTLPPLSPPKPILPPLPSTTTTTMPTTTIPAPSTANNINGADSLVANTNDHWVNTKWRPAMGWMYMIVCITDFIIFPVLWSLLQAVSKGNVTEQWQPLTLQGAGLFHMAMGAVLGIAAYGRTREKIENGKV